MRAPDGEDGGDDPETRDLIEGVIAGLPVRGLAAKGDSLSLTTIDRVVAVLNGEWRAARRGR